jgi:hypothetical protein
MMSKSKFRWIVGKQSLGQSKAKIGKDHPIVGKNAGL